MTLNPARISQVLPESIGAEIGFETGDAIVSINGTRPRDLIDYQFLCADEILELEVLDAKGKTHHIEIEKDWDDDLGLEFESALFDGLIQCNNRCPFCFIDQKPPGMRDTLYLKDDDYRLSFLYGSYLTLTNLSQKEWDRIEQMRLSPLYISVHATEPDVRIRLLKNKRAGRILEQLQWFQERRLQIHAQVVVCPGINDRDRLEKTLLDLAKFGSTSDPESIPAVASVAIVPVGLTKFRPPEDELRPVSPEDARETIALVRSWQEKFRRQLGSTFAWLADEWFLIAGYDLPPASEYEDYPQIDNGVGSIRQFISQFQEALELHDEQDLSKKIAPQEDAFSRLTPIGASPASQAAGAATQTKPGGLHCYKNEMLPNTPKSSRRLTWVVGNAVEKAFQPILQRLNQFKGIEIEMVALNSDFWGQSISVTGVLTGQDLLQGLQGRDLGDAIILPAVMLKHGETRFLDNVTVEQLATELKTPVLPVNGIEEFIAEVLS
ncbi:MAG: DUF512 domain-containing protein [Oscillatoria sp. SIO1A7]|nr:DUF512 domain-containing protein [Oscillatoria sp. SIO1A7]